MNSNAKKTISHFLWKWKEIISLWIRTMFDPNKRRRLEEQFNQMRAAGVDVTSTQARKEWIRKHRKELHKDLELHPTAQPIKRSPKPGRNDPCLCKSGKKYKKCCGN